MDLAPWRRRVPISLLALLSLVAGGRGGASAAPEDGVAWTSVPDPLLGCALESGPETPTPDLAFRLVDEAGRPVAGARVWGVGCGSHGEQGVLDRAQAVRSDARGWVRIPDAVHWGELIAEADGCVAYHEGGPPREGSEVVLARGRDLALEVRDALDRPVPGARVGYRVYCGHTPDLRQVRTGPDGRGVLPAVVARNGSTAWIWPVGENVAGEDVEVREWSGATLVLRLAPSHPVEGSVVDAAGKPVAGAFVGGLTWHRGPWATTDAEGRFRLVGVDPDADLQVDADDASFATPRSVSTVVPPLGTALHVRLGRADAEEPPPRRRVVVHLTDEQGALVLAARVAAWSPEHGWGDACITGWHAVKPGDPYLLRLPDGTYEVEADGWLSGCTSARGRLDVRGDATPELRVSPHPAWHVDARAVPEGARVLLGTAMRRRDVTDEVRAGSVRAPVSEPALLRVVVGDDVWGRSTVLRLPPAPPGPQDPPLALTAPAPVRVHVRAVDSAGRPVAFSAAWVETWDDPSEAARAPKGEAWIEAEMPTLLETLYVHPDDPSLAGVRLRPDLGAAPGPALELPPVVLPPRAASKVEIPPPPGTRADDVVLERVEPGLAAEWATLREDLMRGEQAPDRGSTLRATLPGFAPRFLPLTPPGPWRVAWPSGSIELEAASSSGALERFCLLVDGQAVQAKASRARLRGLAAGKHEVVVCAAGHGAKRAEVMLADGQALGLKVLLEPVPR